MANNNDTARISLIINGTQAQDELADINKSLREARRLRQEAFEKGDAKAYALYRAETHKLESQLRAMQSRGQAVVTTLASLDQATPKKLRDAIRELNRQLNSGAIERGSEEWKEVVSQMKAAKEELAKIREEAKAADQTLSGRVSAWGNKWAGFANTLNIVADKFQSLMQGLAGYVDQYADMAEHMASVTKYTNLDAQAVGELNDAFKKMDTRTPRAQLNDLAADAGRLGIQSKQQVLDFVDAANQINVALGEDLGEDAVRNIGKLAQLFGDEERLGLKRAMLSTASVINDLAQSSSANEGYIMDFTARLAGMGRQAGLTQAQIMGFASIMDQSMVNSEEASTALSKLIQNIYQKPAQMAQAAGLDVKRFTQLVKTDANRAVIEFAQGVERLGGMDNLAPRLKDIQMTGSGVSKTIATLAAHTRELTETQEQAQQAYDQATSVTNEYNTANSTTQARIEKMRQQLTDLKTDLGEQLLPVMISGLTTARSIGTALMTLIKWIPGSATTILTLAAAIGALTLATRISAAAQRAWTLVTAASHAVGSIATALTRAYTASVTANTTATRSATLAQRLWTAAIAAGRAALVPFRALIGLVHVGIIALTQGTRAATVAMRALRITLGASPWGLALIAVTALGAAIYGIVKATQAYMTQTTQLARQQRLIARDQADIERQANADTARQLARIKQLTSVIHDNSLSIRQRQQAIDQLRAIIPAYNAVLTREGQLTQENTKAVDDYTRALKANALQRATQDKLTDIMKERLDADAALKAWSTGNSNLQKKLQQAFSSYKMSPYEQRRFLSYGEAPFRLSNSQLNYIFGLRRRLTKTSDKMRQYGQAVADADARTNGLINTSKRLGQTLGDLPQITPDTPQLPDTPDLPATPATSGGRDTTAPAQRTREETQALKQAERELDRQEARQRIDEATRHAQGLTDTATYREAILKIERDYLKKRRDLYRETDTEWTTYDDRLRDLDQTQARERTQWTLQDLKDQQEAELDQLSEAYYRGELTAEQYERNQFDIRQRYLQETARLYRDTGQADDYEKTLREIESNGQSERYRLHQAYLERIRRLIDQYGTDKLQQLQTQESEALDDLKTALDQQLITHEQYEKMRLALIEEYKKKRQQAQQGDDTQSQSPLTRPKSYMSGSNSDPLSQSLISLYDSVAHLKDPLQEGEQMWERYAGIAVASLSTVSTTIQSVSQLIQAQQQAEIARVTAQYDRQIKAAGQNTQRAQKLEEQKQAQLAKIRTKYNRREMAMQIAQATAQTAMNALLAYGSMAKIPAIGPALGAAAAAAATAAGMIQIAAIKKAQQAQAEGYYRGGYVTPDGLTLISGGDGTTGSGGSGAYIGGGTGSGAYTGGSGGAASSARSAGGRFPLRRAPIYDAGGYTWYNGDPRRPAGLVHGGEFVISHAALAQPAVAAAARLIDHAQRTRTLTRLTPQAVTAALTAPRRTADALTPLTAAYAPDGSTAANGSAAATAHGGAAILTAAAAQTATTAAALTAAQAAARAMADSPTTAATARALTRLADRLDEGITAIARIDGDDGLAHQLARYKRLTGRT